MSELIVISIAAFAASTLTLFSGFGLGTLLMPVFALFFPLPVAVGLTALVHFSNNIFKIALFGKNANKRVVLYFGIPAVFAAVAGAWILTVLESQYPFFTYVVFGKVYELYALKVVIGLLIILFSVMEVLPFFKKMELSPRLLSLGGIISGFFGGLSGHQGAMRSAFLARQGLSKEAFIGSGVVLAFLVDAVRISVYAGKGQMAYVFEHQQTIIAAVSAAFAGVILGKTILKKVTVETVQKIVSIGLVVLGLLLGAGWI